VPDAFGVPNACELRETIGAFGEKLGDQIRSAG
jgi:hypothetical protein